MSLSNKIWLTRKSRINASERLEKNEFWSQILQTYYSALIVVFSIWSLFANELNFSLSIVSLSILLLSTSLFIMSRNFKERSLILKSCYLKLDGLYSISLSLENNGEENTEQLLKLQNEYNDLLSLFENHKKIDFLRTKIESVNKDSNFWKKLTLSEHSYFWGYKVFKFCSILFLIILPIIIVIITNQ